MTRLRDRYEHLIQENDFEGPTFSEWLSKNNLSERDDDKGLYGDENPTWESVTL